ncbi:carnitine O-palmitoyltransferase 2, mitochondrial-like [Acanthaster planci]|uniref:Carnitine O-palmitoyltransferase 2, mitochondrial-like n=1 Tax=Acanthaster planci TaxID=133434 RepID=A0A8B7Z8A8_ACAPL|nr:carnitine O-palmitoyltransferase 2, mitochondrial-like [Acanthaster planci]XP_022101191.1 carnitine O-palmitoyltransferase 2, mitochondrial-like [Acanthaster planci]XP_022101192.1 carnitine O-palmitoyltransferase 2, mitochondrial-like [Acanthaster planci]XP_022101193.1 carnitine O-palmitoyltransferase 2, mitochondrial-like [Acanthaster planci]XP_022101194.1 carnitine O-palmitoyltransferase 2, mitochondrial-like [Acanthaster planci]XP_022101195.1 carnitine O-palmitoyltransferase 2, mitochond
MASYLTQCHRNVGRRLGNLLKIGLGNQRVAVTVLVPCHFKPPKALGTRWFSCSRSVASSADYLQTLSPVPTMLFQPAIPQLPIPSVRDTCQRYLATQHVFLSPKEYAETQSLVGEFQKGAGVDLNNELVELNKTNTHTSYIADFWMDVYLRYRDSVVLNSSPASFITNDPRPEYMDQTTRSTNVTVSILRFLKTLRDDKLLPDAVHRNPAITDTQDFWSSFRTLSSKEAYRHALDNNVQPLDMSQFSRIFNASRIPRPHRDELFRDESQQHVLVISNGHMYVFDVLDISGSLVSAQDIRANLQYIVSHSTSLPPPKYPIGYLTTEHRDTWTQLREKLLAVCPGNKESLRLIDSALFCLCLDDDTDDDKEQLVRRGLHGNAANRWFDKPFQLIVTSSGQLLVNMEHSWGDGVTLRRMFSEVFQDSLDRPVISPGDATGRVDSSERVTRLEFKLDSVISRGIEVAKANHTLATSQLNLQCIQYTKYGSSFIKKFGVSPDAVAQLALQMAYHRVTGQVAATYESCSTAMFKQGRTETIRSATAETKRCTDAFYKNSGVSLAEQRALVKACSDKHRLLSKEATVGQGWDRHLFALRALASSTGRPMPTVFQDPAYVNINTITLSTSTTGVSPSSAGAAFAPVSPSGLGVLYTVFDDCMTLTATSYSTSPSLSDFSESVCSAYDDLYDVMS